MTVIACMHAAPTGERAVLEVRRDGQTLILPPTVKFSHDVDAANELTPALSWQIYHASDATGSRGTGVVASRGLHGTRISIDRPSELPLNMMDLSSRMGPLSIELHDGPSLRLDIMICMSRP